MKLTTRKRQENPRVKFDVPKLKTKEIKQTFQLALHSCFEALQTEEAETTVEQSWANLKEATVVSCEEVLRRPPGNRKPWISDDTWKKVEERRRAKEELNQARTRNQKQVAASKYSEVAGVVKKQLRRDKRAFLNEIADQTEEAAGKGGLKTLYATTRLQSGRKNNPNRPVKDKNGQLLTHVEDQLARWKEHFQETLNLPPPQDPPQLESGTPLNIHTGGITKTEIWKALKSLKNGKVVGVDNIPVEALKEGGRRGHCRKDQESQTSLCHTSPSLEVHCHLNTY